MEDNGIGFSEGFYPRSKERVYEIPGFVCAACTIPEFRSIHRKLLEWVYEHVLLLALNHGAMKLGRVAIYGSKVKANASKHRAMS